MDTTFRCKYLGQITKEQFRSAADELKSIVDAATSSNGIGELYKYEYSDDVISFDIIKPAKKGWVHWVAEFRLYRCPVESARTLGDIGAYETSERVARAYPRNGQLLLGTAMRVVDKHTNNALQWLPIPSVFFDDIISDGFLYRDPRLKRSKSKTKKA
ncbi:MAG: hypothetical protein ACE37H_03625 [Phycisphaeraceae bacterium]